MRKQYVKLADEKLEDLDFVENFLKNETLNKDVLTEYNEAIDKAFKAYDDSFNEWYETIKNLKEELKKAQSDTSVNTVYDFASLEKNITDFESQCKFLQKERKQAKLESLKKEIESQEEKLEEGWTGETGVTGEKKPQFNVNKDNIDLVYSQSISHNKNKVNDHQSSFSALAVSDLLYKAKEVLNDKKREIE